eukprot:gene1037-1125_t
MVSGNAGLRLLDACYDDVAYARYLLRSRLPSDRNVRTKINWKDQQSGSSLLHCLSYSDLSQPIKLLLDNNADPNLVNHNLETPLHWCAKMNSTNCAKILLDYGADINAVDNSSSTALHYASSLGNIEMVMILLDRGAKVDILDKDEKTAIELAAEGTSSTAKAVAVVFLRHYQRLGLPTAKGLKSKIQSMNSVLLFPKESTSLSVMDGMLKSPYPGVFEQSHPSPSQFRETPSQPPLSSSSVKPRTLLDEIREEKNASFTSQKSSMSMATGRSPSRPTSGERNKRNSPSGKKYPPMHFGIQPSPNSAPSHRPSSASSASPGRPGATAKGGGRPVSAGGLVTPSKMAMSPSIDSKVPMNSPFVAAQEISAGRTMSQLLPPTAAPTSSSEIQHHSPSSSSAHTMRSNSMDSLKPLQRRTFSHGLSSTSDQRQQQLLPRAQSADMVLTEVNDEDEVTQYVDNITSTSVSTPMVSHTDHYTVGDAGMRSRRFMSAPVVPATRLTLDTDSILRAEEFAKGKQSSPNRSRRALLEQRFPPASCIPFLPRLPADLSCGQADYLDVILTVEHCVDCHLHSDQSLRHDPKKYVTAAINVLYGIIQAIVTSKFKVRLFAIRSAPMNIKRLGAFEVTLAICLPVVESYINDSNIQLSASMFGSNQTLSSLLQVPDPRRSLVMKPQWISHNLFSKLENKSWPAVNAMEEKATNFLDAALQDAARGLREAQPGLSDAVQSVIGSANHRVAGHLSELVYGNYKHNELDTEALYDLEKAYQAWQERMKMPIQIVKDPLDVDIPALFSPSQYTPQKAGQLQRMTSRSSSQHMVSQQPTHSKGPYLDRNLAQALPQEEFERVVLEHFFVFDNR